MDQNEKQSEPFTIYVRFYLLFVDIFSFLSFQLMRYWSAGDVHQMQRTASSVPTLLIKKSSQTNRGIGLMSTVPMLMGWNHPPPGPLVRSLFRKVSNMINEILIRIDWVFVLITNAKCTLLRLLTLRSRFDSLWSIMTLSCTWSIVIAHFQN